jgi:hypothetical protein
MRRARRSAPWPPVSAVTVLEPPELGWAPGAVVTYRCGDRADVWYLEVDEDDLPDERLGPGA